jgi:uncharacterized protein
MKLATALFLVASLTCGQGASAQAVSADKRAEIERLIEVTGVMAITQQLSNVFITNITQIVKKQNPNVPQQVLNATREEVNAVFAEQLPIFKEMCVVLYDKYFTLDEVRGLTQFYETPLGKKTISVMPALTQESLTLGMRWGQAMEPVIDQRIRARFKKENIQL